jgi:hypothetical protein
MLTEIRKDVILESQFHVLQRIPQAAFIVVDHVFVEFPKSDPVDHRCHRDTLDDVSLGSVAKLLV